MAHRIDREVPRNLVEKALGGLDGLGELALPDAQVGFLHDIVDVADGGKRATEVGLQLAVMGVHLLLEPTLLIPRGGYTGGGRSVEGRAGRHGGERWPSGLG